MSNNVCIEPTVFVNERTGCKSHGVRVYDDYDQTYDNNFEFIPADDMDVLKLVRKSCDEKIGAMLDFIVEEEKGIEIGGTWYDWAEIKGVLCPEEVE